MSGFDDPRNITFAKRQLNELCSVISKEHGFHLREMLILFSLTSCFATWYKRNIRHTSGKSLRPSH